MYLKMRYQVLLMRKLATRMQCCVRKYSNNINAEDIPIKFSTSQASLKGAVRPVIKFNKTDDVPWYQPISVVFSTGAFLFYFCVLREENDMDREFEKTLFDRMPGLEKKQLLILYKYNKEEGKSVEDIERRLKELEALET